MKNTIVSTTSSNSLWTMGLIFLGASLATFLLTMSDSLNSFDFFSVGFFVNYGLFIIYFLWVGSSNRIELGRFWRFKDIRVNALLLALGNISAYSLNRTLTVFQTSVEWLTVFLVLLNAAMILGAVRLQQQRHNDWINHGIVAILSIGVLFQVYQIIYLLPVMGFGTLTFWFFGIPLHAFIPLWYVIFLVRMLVLFYRQSTAFRQSLLIGLSIPLFFFAYVLRNWSLLNQSVKQAYHTRQAAFANQDLPEWAALGAYIEKGWVTKRALKSGIVYTAFDESRNVFNSIDRIGSFNERQMHDPFIAAASLVLGPVRLTANQKIGLLKAVYNQRHQTEERLWSGDNLSTSDIVTNVQLFPSHRLSYTEKTLTIENKKSLNSWTPTEEAIYSFYLPEGAVVTSASLWVAGEERPSFLTTKAKADSAYTTIVGRERRDPLLLHWREGNRISVRVFPCTPQEPRQFKIGVTAPLTYHDGQLTYQNIDFTGPDWSKATESINVVSEGALRDFDWSFGSTLLGTGLQADGTSYRYQGAYKSDWQLHMAAPALSHDAFSFNGKSFSLSETTQQLHDFHAGEIYLDINAAWSKSEFRELWEMMHDREVYVFTTRLERMTDDNYMALFKQLRRHRFTVFPLYHIQNPERALVITKAANITPTLSDMEESAFAKSTNDFMQRLQSPMRLYSLDSELSAYFQMMKSLRLFHCAQGDREQLATWLQQGKFPDTNENAQRVRLDESQVFIEQLDASDRSTAPDHLMRLFAYNDVMKQLGKNYFNRQSIENELVSTAEEAHVVTPISSLIVLETQADYDRFDIKKSNDSLENASIKSSGAVPEPHEWLLILLTLGFVIFIKWRVR